MRNHYEAEVGTFENAITIDGDTFREVLPEAIKEVENKKGEKSYFSVQEASAAKKPLHTSNTKDSQTSTNSTEALSTTNTNAKPKASILNSKVKTSFSMNA